MKREVEILKKSARVKAQHGHYCQFRGEGKVRQRKERKEWQHKRWAGRTLYGKSVSGDFWQTNEWGFTYYLEKRDGQEKETS